LVPLFDIEQVVLGILLLSHESLDGQKHRYPLGKFSQVALSKQGDDAQ
jgi:hypothetical protein